MKLLFQNLNEYMKYRIFRFKLKALVKRYQGFLMFNLIGKRLLQIILIIDNNLKGKEGFGMSKVASEVVAAVLNEFHLAIKSTVLSRRSQCFSRWKRIRMCSSTTRCSLLRTMIEINPKRVVYVFNHGTLRAICGCLKMFMIAIGNKS